MDILGYEIDIYLVMVVIAGIFVLSIMFLLGKSLVAGKPASKKAKRKTKPGAKSTEVPQDKLEEDPQEKPLPNQDAQQASGKLMEQSSEIASSPGKELVNAEKGAGTPAGADAGKTMPAVSRLWETTGANKEKETGAPGGTDAVKAEPVVTRLWETPEMKAEAEKAGITADMSKLLQPSTLKETEEEPKEDEESDGVMDIFGEEIADESGLTDLAAKLADIDLNDLKKLGNDVSQVLPKKNTPTANRR